MGRDAPESPYQDGVSLWMRIANAIWDSRDAVNRESDHKVAADVDFDPESGTFTAVLRCKKCWHQQGFQVLVPQRVQYGEGAVNMLTGESVQAHWLRAWLMRNWIPMTADLMEMPCRDRQEAAAMAEQVTKWCAEAGAAGIPASRALGRLLLLGYQSDYVADVLKRLDFGKEVDGEAWLALPEGHPDRTW